MHSRENSGHALLPAIEPAPGTVEVLHAVAGGSSSGPCDSGLFFLGVRPVVILQRQTGVEIIANDIIEG